MSTSTTSSDSSVVLVNVPYGAEGRSMRPLGLAYLGAYLLTEGFTVHGVDLGDASPQRLPELASRFNLAKYPIVGLSFYNTNASVAYELASIIKAANPDVITVAGGPHASALFERMLANCPAIDAVVKNEGELPFAALLRAFSEQTHDPIPGVARRLGSRVIVGADPPRLDDLNRIPAPTFQFQAPAGSPSMVFYDEVDNRPRRATALVTSRSCPYSCSFCAIILIGRRWRAASPEKVIADIQELEASQQATYEHVYFLDANFFVNANRTIAIAEALQRFRPGITFSFSTRANQLVRAADSITTLRQLGLRAVEIGVESGSQAALKRYAKDTTVEQNDRAISILRANGIKLLLDFIMFDAFASLEDIDRNLAFLERNGLDVYTPWDHLYSHLVPYLGTGIRDQYESLIDDVQFNPDELPEPSALIRCPDVRAIFDELCRFRAETGGDLRRRVETLQAQIEHSPADPTTLLELTALRRLPFRIASILAQRARSRESITAPGVTLLSAAHANAEADSPQLVARLDF